jgi:hypothetical protein
VLSELWRELKTDAGFVMSITGTTSAKILAICVTQFGTILVSDSYESQGLPDSDAQDHLSTLFLVGNLISMFMTLSLGFLSDRVKIYVLITLLNILVVSASALIIYDIYTNDYITYLFDIGFIVI